MMYKKVISILLLLSYGLLVTPQKAQSAEKGIFLTYSSAKKMYSDLDFYKKDAEAKERLLILTSKDLSKCDENNSLKDRKMLGLVEDKKILSKTADNYKELYIDADKKRVKAENSKPSRFTWFSIGAMTALALTVFGVASIN